MSGWFNLQQWYPDEGGEKPLLILRGRSGRMGLGVALNGVLKLTSYQSGLGVGIWRLFGPFQKPLRIAWSEIEAEPSSSFFVPMVKLHLGKPSNGTLKISARSWSRLVDAASKTGSASEMQMPAAVPVSAGSLARAMLVQWAAVSAIAGGFLFFASRSAAPHGGAPAAISIAIPALVFGIAQIVRYARES
jgi:hypothetical protein